MISAVNQAYILHLREDYEKKYTYWHQAHDIKQWRDYLLENYCFVIRSDSMRGDWLDFGTDQAEATFNNLAEQHKMWNCLTT